MEMARLFFTSSICLCRLADGMVMDQFHRNELTCLQFVTTIFRTLRRLSIGFRPLIDEV